MTCILGIDIAPFSVHWERSLQTLGAIHFLMISLVLPVLAIVVPVYMVCFRLGFDFKKLYHNSSQANVCGYSVTAITLTDKYV